MTWLINNNNTKFSRLPPDKNVKINGKAYLFIILLPVLILLAFFTSSKCFHKINLRSGVVLLDPKISYLHTISDYYLSFAIDALLLRKMDSLPILNKKFVNLARHLSPAYVRYGGTSADCLFFNETLVASEEVNLVNGEDISNFTISKEDFQSLHEFSEMSNLKMLFDLNALIRRSDGSWDDSNAKNIINFAKKNNMKIDWQLGNEPPSFPLLFNTSISPEQLAKDYYNLRSLLDSSGYKDSILIGPEVNQVGGPSYSGENYTKIFLKHARNSIKYISWHQYYLRGEDAQVKDFINATTFNYLPYLINSMQEAIDSTGYRIPMWLSETSTAYDSGTPGISDRFVAGFLWLDKLGYSAKAGIKVVIRQSFFGGNYAMVAPDLSPNPDWWISVIYKQFVSNKVLNISAPNNFGNLRLYAHCTPKNVFLNSITIFGANIAENPISISMQTIALLRQSYISLYVLTSDSLQSRSIQMNGNVLKLLPNGNLPPFKPISLGNRKLITFPAYSMFFIVVQDENISMC